MAATSEPHIPFNKVAFGESERRHLAAVLSSVHVSGNGAFTRACQTLLERALPAANVLLTTNCTHALEMAALLLDIQPGDEVILPSFTFVSTANAFVLRGARPVFVDIRPDTLNIDETHIEKAITPRSKAIVAVHYAGVACAMDDIMRIAGRHNLAVVEDNAHGLFGRYRGRNLGTFGRLATQSFHETKNFTCGEGGAIVVNDPSLAERAEILREKGTDRARYYRGQVDKYSWVDLGSSYLPSDILAAILLAQLERRDEIQAARRAIWERYDRGLADWAARSDVALPYVPDDCEQSYHMFYLLLPSLDARQALIRHLGDRGISAVFHYVPLHDSAFARHAGWDGADCPVTISVSNRLVRLPFYTTLGAADQDRVIEAVNEFAGGRTT